MANNLLSYSRRIVEVTALCFILAIGTISLSGGVAQVLTQGSSICHNNPEVCTLWGEDACDSGDCVDAGPEDFCCQPEPDTR